MRPGSGAGRLVGILMLVHLPVGLMLPYIVLSPVLAAPGFLANASAGSARVHAAVLLLFLSGAITVAVAMAGLPVFRRYGDRPAFLLLVLSAANLALHAVENGTLLSMLSLSQQYASAGAGETKAFEALAAVVGTARRWAHFTHLLVLGSWILALHGVLWRCAVIPRALAALGVLGAALQITGVPLAALLGFAPVTPMAMPLAPIYLTVGLWLTVKGFGGRREGSDGMPSAGAA